MRPHPVCPSRERILKSRTDDVMKSPSINDKRVLRLCNPLALRLSRGMRFMWPAINRRSHLGFLIYLMTIPIESIRLMRVLSKCKDSTFFPCAKYLNLNYSVQECLTNRWMDVDDIPQVVKRGVVVHQYCNFLNDVS